MALDKQTVTRIAAEAQIALNAVAEKYELTVKVGGGSYDPEAGTFKPRVEFVSEDAGAVKFLRYASLFGLEPTDFGKRITLKNRTFSITGINPRRPKFPIDIEEVSTGKVMKATESSVKAALAVEKRQR
jgi:hypothetical protein